ECEVRPLEPARRRKNHVRVPARRAREEIDADERVELAERPLEPARAGDGAQRIAGDDDQRAYALLALGEDLVGEDPAGEAVEDARKAPDAARRSGAEEAGRPCDARALHRERAEERAAAPVVVAAQEREGLESDVAQGAERPLVHADRHVESHAARAVDGRGELADLGGTDAGHASGAG